MIHNHNTDIYYLTLLPRPSLTFQRQTTPILHSATQLPIPHLLTDDFLKEYSKTPVWYQQRPKKIGDGAGGIGGLLPKVIGTKPKQK